MRGQLASRRLGAAAPSDNDADRIAHLLSLGRGGWTSAATRSPRASKISGCLRERPWPSAFRRDRYAAARLLRWLNAVSPQLNYRTHRTCPVASIQAARWRDLGRACATSAAHRRASQDRCQAPIHAKHLVEGARDVIKRIGFCSDIDSEPRSAIRLREHLERSTGMDTKELATFTDR